jgi:hypothetical protein
MAQAVSAGRESPLRRSKPLHRPVHRAWASGASHGSCGSASGQSAVSRRKRASKPDAPPAAPSRPALARALSVDCEEVPIDSTFALHVMRARKFKTRDAPSHTGRGGSSHGRGNQLRGTVPKVPN